MAAHTEKTDLSYASAGVDRQAGDHLVDRIAILAKSTLNKKVKASVGGYASLYELDKRRWLAASTDGVGTKLKLAFRLREHRTVGIDLVAMSVNDLLCVGAEPLFFLDYLATGKLDLGVAEQVLEGIVQGCKQAGCALVGGETAEMPDFYSAGEYDLGGFAVGMVDPKQVLPRRDLRVGDVILGLASSGFHSTGYSLLRKLIADGAGGDAQARALLTPTRIYAHSLGPLIRKGLFKGLAHITGSGFLNVPRMSEKVSYRIDLPATESLPPVFGWLKSTSQLTLSERAQTFNQGVGMVAVVDPRKSTDVMKRLKRAGEKVWVLGEVIRRKKGEPCELWITQDGESARLVY